MRPQILARQNRLKFVITLSCLAASYGALLTYRLLGWQADIISDVIKSSIFIFGSTLLASYFFWSIIKPKVTGPAGGALAGGLTAIFLIPLPTLAGGFKSSFVTQGHDFAASLSNAAVYSFSTFSAAEGIAIPLSMAVGIWAGVDNGQ